MPNNCLSVLYKRIIQVENKNVGLKVWGGGGTNIPLPSEVKRSPIFGFAQILESRVKKTNKARNRPKLILLHINMFD